MLRRPKLAALCRPEKETLMKRSPITTTLEVIAVAALVLSVTTDIVKTRREFEFRLGSAWADRRRPRRFRRQRRQRMAQPASPELADLVYQGDLDRAIEVAQPLTPDEIRKRLLADDERFLADQGPCDVFLRRWYATLKSPFLRAEAADCFVSAYTTELAPVPNGEYIGAYMRTESLRELITKVASAILGPELKDLEETPEHPLDGASAEKWRAAGRILAGLDLPPAVSPVAPVEEEVVTQF
ncbi:MAG: hypothetical protein H7248_03790 [Microbacteriaceae bacterium]|nr:hypothetical protein [Microbacteriaceae bacterium]